MFQFTSRMSNGNSAFSSTDIRFQTLMPVSLSQMYSEFMKWKKIFCISAIFFVSFLNVLTCSTFFLLPIQGSLAILCIISRGSQVLTKNSASFIFSLETGTKLGSNTYFGEGLRLTHSRITSIIRPILIGLYLELLEWEILRVPGAQVAVYFVTLNIQLLTKSTGTMSRN